jgi:glyoxylase-like metal-dependent hydrolase (beta-lactamase superfamily II)
MTNALEFPFETLPAPGAALNLGAGVQWLRMPLPFALDHINLWLLEDGAGVAIVDTGLGNSDTRALWEHIFATLDRPVTRVIVTHAHPDHIGNAQWLSARFGVPVLITLGEYMWAHTMYDQSAGYGVEPMLEFFCRHGFTDEQASALRGLGHAYQEGVPELPWEYLRLYDGDRLRIGAHDWQVIVGYGHSSEHAALWCVSLNMLISGDMLLPRISTNVSTFSVTPQDDPVGRYTASLGRFAALPADMLVLPSHGKPFRGAHARIQQLCAHHEERCAELLAALTHPMHAGDLLDTLFPRKLGPHELRFAMGEAIAHLNYLAARGVIHPVESPDGVLRFEKTSASR